VILLVDCSGSMEGDKLAQAQRGGQDFARDALQRGHNVGLVRFACDASPVLDIGASLAPIARALASLSADGGTNMAAGIRLAHAALLAAKRGRNTICLVTDGAPNDPDATLRVAEAAKADRIRIVAVGTDDADKAFLDLLVSRAEFARKIEASSLMLGVREMALLLPKP
jgi:Ca-activated chloride channel family protein